MVHLVGAHHRSDGCSCFAIANGLIGAFEIPARQSLVIELVGREDLPGAIALNSSGFNLARIVGPSIGAIIIAQLGIAWCFGVNALSYVTVLVGLFLIRLPAWMPPERLVAPLDGIREALALRARHADRRRRCSWHGRRCSPCSACRT